VYFDFNANLESIAACILIIDRHRYLSFDTLVVAARKPDRLDYKKLLTNSNSPHRGDRKISEQVVRRISSTCPTISLFYEEYVEQQDSNAAKALIAFSQS